MTYALGILFAFLTGLVVIFGDIALKLAAERSGPAIWTLLTVGILTYAASAVLWFWAMRHTTLAQAAVAYSMFTLLALAVIGVWWFEERLAAREWAGIGLALASMVLMARLS